MSTTEASSGYDMHKWITNMYINFVTVYNKMQ